MPNENRMRPQKALEFKLVLFNQKSNLCSVSMRKKFFGSGNALTLDGELKAIELTWRFMIQTDANLKVSYMLSLFKCDI